MRATKNYLATGYVVSPERWCLLTGRNDVSSSENSNPSFSVDAVPAPAAPPGCPLLLNRFQGRRHDQPRAGAPACRHELPAAARNGRGEEFASPLLHVGLARDRKRGKILERADLPRMQPRLIKQLVVVRNGFVCVQEKRLAAARRGAPGQRRDRRMSWPRTLRAAA